MEDEKSDCRKNPFSPGRDGYNKRGSFFVPASWREIRGVFDKAMNENHNLK